MSTAGVGDEVAKEWEVAGEDWGNHRPGSSGGGKEGGLSGARPTSWGSHSHGWCGEDRTAGKSRRCAAVVLVIEEDGDPGNGEV